MFKIKSRAQVAEREKEDSKKHQPKKTSQRLNLEKKQPKKKENPTVGKKKSQDAFETSKNKIVFISEPNENI